MTVPTEKGTFRWAQEEALAAMSRLAEARHEQQLAQGWLEKAVYDGFN